MPQFTHDISESKVPRYHRTRDIIGRDYNFHGNIGGRFLCPRIERSGAYSFWPVRLFVCLSVCLQKL